MSKIVSKTAQSVQDILTAKGLKCRVVEFSSSTAIAVKAAHSIGCDVAQIVKSLIFKTALTQQPVLVLASGCNRVNEQAIEQQVGEQIIKADAEFTRNVTGFAIGGIPPIGHKTTIKHIYIDEDLLKLDNLWAAAGTPHTVFNIQTKDLLAIVNGKVISIK